jgi:hypothetical protein
MPHISKEKVKEMRDKIKKEFPHAVFSVVTEHHSTIKVALMESEFPCSEKYMQLNHYYLKDNHNGEPWLPMMERVKEIICADKKTESVDGDYGNIPNYYVRLEIGKWDKPYKQKIK